MANLLSLLTIIFLSLSSFTLGNDLVRSSCSHASYPNLCLRTLSNYANQANTPRDLAQASIVVCLSHADKVSSYLSELSKLRKGSDRQKLALRDCVEQISDSVDELKRSLMELKHLRTATFRWQMSNAETWVSAALTNEYTCVDGFQGVEGSVKADVKQRISSVAKVTSNALYLINRLEASRRSGP